MSESTYELRINVGDDCLSVRIEGKMLPKIGEKVVVRGNGRNNLVGGIYVISARILPLVENWRKYGCVPCAWAVKREQ